MRTLFTAIVCVALVAICAATCPSKQKHTAAVVEQISENIKEEISLYLEEETAIQSFVDNISAEEVEQNLEINTYVVCNVGKIKGKTVSFGILGHAFALNFDLPEIFK